MGHYTTTTEKTEPSVRGDNWDHKDRLSVGGDVINLEPPSQRGGLISTSPSIVLAIMTRLWLLILNTILLRTVLLRCRALITCQRLRDGNLKEHSSQQVPKEDNAIRED